MRRVVVLSMVMVIALATLGVGYAQWATMLDVDTTVHTGTVDIDFSSVVCSDIPGQPDLGNTKDVGQATCTLVDTDGDGSSDVLEIVVTNAYPSYELLIDLVIRGNGSVPVHIIETSLVDNTGGALDFLEGFWTNTNLVCLQIHQADTVAGSIWLHVVQAAQQDTVYTFQVVLTGNQWNESPCTPEDQELGGTPGFWKSWDSHNTYTQTEIEGWLVDINFASDWLGPTTVGAMESWLGAPFVDIEEKFKAQYLATRLDMESGRLTPTFTHDVTAQDPTNYLGLADPTSATLSEIVSAIEGKHGTSPDNDELEVMKDVCDALNNLEI